MPVHRSDTGLLFYAASMTSRLVVLMISRTVLRHFMTIFDFSCLAWWKCHIFKKGQMIKIKCSALCHCKRH